MLTYSGQFVGSPPHTGGRESLDTGNGCYLSPPGTERSEVNARSPLQRSGRRSQRGLRLSSSLNDLSDLG